MITYEILKQNTHTYTYVCKYVHTYICIILHSHAYEYIQQAHMYVHVYVLYVMNSL